MGDCDHLDQSIRFGAFEVNLRSGELRKAGVRIKLQEQPFKVLAALLEQPGQVVPREELRKRIWPGESFGDFDHAVNIAIAKLRSALGDSAASPHLIETLHRRGYRFILPLTPVAGTQADLDNFQVSPTRRVGGVFAKSRWTSMAMIFVPVFVLGGLCAWFSRPLPPPRVIRTAQLTHDGFSKTGVLTDGFRLYITETNGSKQFLVQAATTGGDASIVPTPLASIVTSDISRDHSQMLVADAAGPKYEFPVWILPLPAGPPRRLGDVVARCDSWSSQGWATWSPDGRQIAYARDSEIDIANAQGLNPRTLVRLPGYASEIRFSPDGTHLRFTLRSVQSNMFSSIWDVRSDGSDLHPILPGWHNPPSNMAGDWSQDGRYYFFTSADDPNRASIWAIREAHGFLHRRASSPIELTTGPMAVYFNGMSSDGRRIFAGGWTSRGELVRYEPRSHEFLPFLGGISATELDFSRDGNWVTYVSSPEETLWRSRVDGSDRLQLTASPVRASQPRWSPDGNKIVFVDKHIKPFWRMLLIRSEGGTPQELRSETQYETNPQWSPDGRRIVFGRLPWLWTGAEKFAIQILDVNSKQVSIVPESQGLFSPRWSPDGRHLLALSPDSKKLFRFDFGTRKWASWLREAGSISHPTWSRDSKYVYYDSVSTKNAGYRRVEVGHTHSEFLIDLRSLNRGGPDYSSGLGPWSGLAPDGSPLFVRNLSSDEVYALEVELP